MSSKDELHAKVEKILSGLPVHLQAFRDEIEVFLKQALKNLWSEMGGVSYESFKAQQRLLQEKSEALAALEKRIEALEKK